MMLCTYKNITIVCISFGMTILHVSNTYIRQKIPAATKLANKIQQAAITAANPITNPINNQLLAPLAPKQPPL